MSAKRIFITGAGSGFGREAALRLAQKGHQVIAGVQVAPQATDLRKEATDRGINLRVEKVDLLSEMDRRFALGWEIDVLVSNGALGESGPIAEMPLEIFRALFETNVFANLAIVQGFVRQMVKRGKGRVVFVSSMAGLATFPLFGAYCATKHAIEAIAEAMHSELKPHGVQVATINPGAYLTGFNDRMFEAHQRWFDPKVNFTRPKDITKMAEILKTQFDPEELIQAMVEVAESDSGLFRNVRPKEVEDFLKKDQQEAWTRQQS